MKFSPLVLLSFVSLSLGDQLDDWVDTDGMDRSVVRRFNDAIDSCDSETNSHDMFVHCINDHIHYFRSDFTADEEDDIRRGARNSDVHRRGRNGRGGRNRDGGRDGRNDRNGHGGRGGRDGRDGRDGRGDRSSNGDGSGRNDGGDGSSKGGSGDGSSKDGSRRLRAQ